MTSQQMQVCLKYDVPPVDAPPNSIAGVAANTRGAILPVNGLRHPPERGTNGWYIWAGENLSSDPDFFQSVHVRHLIEWRPEVEKFLCLPPGWRFLVAGTYEDAWYDQSLLATRKGRR